MRIEQVAEHAKELAREVVQLGLADRGLVRQLYQDYAQQLQQGDGGSFAQLLLERGAIDEAAYQRLVERFPLPPPASTGYFPAGAARAEAGLGMTRAEGDRTPQPDVSNWRDPPTRPQGGVLRDLESSARIRPARPAEPRLEPEPAPAPPPDLTMAYEDVLPSPASLADAVQGSAPDATIGYDGVLEAPAAGWGPLQEEAYEAQAPSGFDSTSSEPEGGQARSPHHASSASELKLRPDPGQGEEEFFQEGEPLPGGADGPQREPDVGEVMGDYQLESILGRGGMGVIYLAKKIGTEERVALKALTVGVGEGGQKRRARFQREVEALRRLSHPNIVKIHGCGRKGPWDWYAMEYVDGRELKAVIREAKLTRPEALQVFLDICDAVQHAHERGVIHRDLKPANVLVTSDLRVCVLDFGLAKIADEGLELTKTGAALGTPYYMAPEQLLSPKDVDARSDVWSLGVLLYELLVGERPFTGETAGEVGTKIMSSEPVRPSKLNPALHTSLDQIVLKALTKDPAHRYQDVAALRRDVAKFKRGSSLRAMTDMDAAAEFVRRWLHTHRVAVAVGFALASLVYWPVIFLVYAFM